MKKILLLVVAGIVILLVIMAACSGGDGEDEAEDDAAQTPPPQRDCLATPVAAGQQPRAGKVGTRYNSYGEVDCNEVFGGEEIREQAVLATNTNGAFDFDLDKGIENCLLGTDTSLEVRPQVDIVLRVDDGEVTCTFGQDGGDQTIAAGDQVVIIDDEYRTTALLAVTDDGSTVAVTRGFAVVAPPDLGCRSVVGPLQQAELAEGAKPVFTPIDALLIPDQWQVAFERVDSSVEPPPAGSELVPGLSAFIDASEVTVLVDGELITGEAEQGIEHLPILEMLTGSRLAVALPGQISVIEPLELEEPFIVEFPDRVFVPPVTLVELQPVVEMDDLARALQEVEPIEPAYRDLLIDPDGRRWTLAYNGSDIEVAAEIDSTIHQQLEAGMFGTYYAQTFEVEPNYDLLLPDLLEGAPSCRS